MPTMYHRYNDFHKASEFIDFKINKFGLRLADVNSQEDYCFTIETCDETTSTQHLCDIPLVRYLINYGIFPLDWNYRYVSEIKARHTKQIYYNISDIYDVAKCLINYKEKLNKKTNKKPPHYTTENRNMFII